MSNIRAHQRGARPAIVPAGLLCALLNGGRHG